MQRNTFLVSVVGGAVALVAVGAVGTHLLAGTESTSELDRHSSVTVDGHRALSAEIVAGRTAGRYHALPWVGKELTDVFLPDRSEGRGRGDDHLHRQGRRRAGRRHPRARRPGRQPLRHLDVPALTPASPSP
jgi:hypothetical protein